MKRAFFLILLSLLILAGCTSVRNHTKCKCGENCTTNNSLKSETEKMRNSIDESIAGKERKLSNKGFLYGGLSPEAKEIEDHLYGN